MELQSIKWNELNFCGIFIFKHVVHNIIVDLTIEERSKSGQWMWQYLEMREQKR